MFYSRQKSLSIWKMYRKIVIVAAVMAFILTVLINGVHSHTFNIGSCPRVEPVIDFDMSKVKLENISLCISCILKRSVNWFIIFYLIDFLVSWTLVCHTEIFNSFRLLDIRFYWQQFRSFTKNCPVTQPCCFGYHRYNNYRYTGALVCYSDCMMNLFFSQFNYLYYFNREDVPDSNQPGFMCVRFPMSKESLLKINVCDQKLCIIRGIVKFGI